jgi:D-threo-aldose 1-dehydrogenase
MVQLSERRRLGKSEVVLPPLGFGCAPIGEIYDRISDTQAAETFEAALAAGVRYFDVAPSYGAGLAEMRIGRALRTAADQPGAVHVAREDIFLSTKVSQQLVPDRAVTANTRDHADGHGWAGGLNGFNSVIDCTYEGFMTQHTESLHRMGLSHVDGLR